MTRRSLVLICLFSLFAFAGPKKALIIDGRNNHDWRATTPVLKQILEEKGLFKVDVVTAPADNEGLKSFNPSFKGYAVVVLNYNDFGPKNAGDWPEATQLAFLDYVKRGGGVVSYHAADNAFPKWVEFNKVIGLGGWSGRNEKDGPYIRWRDGKVVRDTMPGIGGSHGPRHAFRIDMRNLSHPISKGLPEKWMHAVDELYDRLRGPAENLDLLATAFSAPENRGTGESEPILFTIQYGKGRIFHTTLGHDVPAMQCVGFIVTLQRGAEWAATGKVKQKAPADFPGPDKISTRTF
ncbi:MAG TPA: ThuA domain-containing protein [Bryobacteraceae bacterium]|nr:ThuA domain-containing protein [Bryobacteraceae bacterium]